MSALSLLDPDKQTSIAAAGGSHRRAWSAPWNPDHRSDYLIAYIADFEEEPQLNYGSLLATSVVLRL